MKSAINLKQKLATFSAHWSPKIIAEMNGHHFKLAKLQGEFIWHKHAKTDETFIVLEGEMTIHFRDGDVDLTAGEMYVVPKGVEHNVSAKEECQLMLVESAGSLNTGDRGGERTAEDNVWI